MKYWNEERKYEKPVFIDFDEPIKVKFTELREFLESYRPFPCSDVYLHEKFEYGDFDNWVDAIIESKLIDPSYCRIYKEDLGIFKTGETEWGVTSRFWHYRENKPFWLNAPNVGYDGETYHTKSIDEIEITVNGVYVIAWYDKTKIENGGKY